VVVWRDRTAAKAAEAEAAEEQLVLQQQELANALAVSGVDSAVCCTQRHLVGRPRSSGQSSCRFAQAALLRTYGREPLHRPGYSLLLAVLALEAAAQA